MPILATSARRPCFTSRSFTEILRERWERKVAVATAMRRCGPLVASPIYLVRVLESICKTPLRHALMKKARELAMSADCAVGDPHRAGHRRRTAIRRY